MAIIPVNGNLAVATVEVVKKSQSGIILSGMETKVPNQGKIIAVSTDVSGLNVGDIVLWERGKGQLVDTDEQQVIVINQKDVLAIVGE